MGSNWKRRTAANALPRQTCGAVGLLRGDCGALTYDGSVYCSYHSKLANGTIDYCMELSRNVQGWASVSPVAVYPVWPLPPVGGYELLSEAA